MSETVRRVRFEEADDGAIDDIAITGDEIKMLRLERMNDGAIWGKVYMNDGTELRLDFTGDKQRRVNFTGWWE